MSIITAVYLGFLIVFVSNVTVNGSLIRLFCQYPNSELCKTFHQLNSLNRYNAELSQLNSRYPNVEDGLTVDEEIPLLINELQEFSHSSYPTNEVLLRCINLGDNNCNNGALPGSGKDDDYLIGNGNPGKRSQSNGNGYEKHLKFGRF